MYFYSVDNFNHLDTKINEQAHELLLPRMVNLQICIWRHLDHRLKYQPKTQLSVLELIMAKG